MSEKYIHASDIGNGSTDVMTSSEKVIEFPSLVKKVTDRKSFDGDETPFVTSFGEFLVGRQCLGERNRPRNVDSAFYSSETARVLFCKTLEVCKSKTPIFVSGLPSALWKEHKDKFAKNIRSWAKAEGFDPERVLVLPQHSGPFYDPNAKDKDGRLLDQSKLFAGRYLIIDIGRGTIDIGLFDKGTPKENPDEYYGEPEGVYHVYSNVITALKTGRHSIFSQSKKKKRADGIPENYSMPNDLDLEMLNQFVRKGSYLFRGENYSTRPLIEDQCATYCDTLLEKCLSKVQDIDYLDGAIVAGGGADVLGRELLSKHIKCPIYIPYNASHSIVRGFYYYALSAENRRKIKESVNAKTA